MIQYIQDLLQQNLVESFGFGFEIDPSSKRVWSMLLQSVGKRLRGLVLDDKVFLWDAHHQTHDDILKMIQKSGLSEAKRYIQLWLSLDGPEVSGNHRYGLTDVAALDHGMVSPGNVDFLDPGKVPNRTWQEILLGLRYHTRMRESVLVESIPRTLYHGTLRRNIPSIQAIGLWPSLGEFTTTAYDEAIQAGVDLPELVFAADKEGLTRCLSAIGSYIQMAYPNEYKPYGVDAIQRYGALCVLKQGETGFDRRPEFDDISEYPYQVEPGDYYRDSSVKVDYILTGAKMINFLRRQDAIVKSWRDFRDISLPNRKPQMATESEMTPDELVQKLVQEHGLTRDFREAGYILPDGRMVDFSGRHHSNHHERQGDYFQLKRGQRFDDFQGQRYLDHRDIPHEPEQLGLQYDQHGQLSGTVMMHAFMQKTGAIRNMPGTGVTLMVKPGAYPIARDPNPGKLYTGLATAMAGHRIYFPEDSFQVDIILPSGGYRSKEFDLNRARIGNILKWIRSELGEKP